MDQKQCEVLVLGGGGAGLVAGVRAASLGRKVIILEKASFLGGGMLFASTMRTFRSKWQKERGIEDQSNAFIRSMMDLTLWRLDPKLVKNAILGTGAFFDWYSEIETEENLAKYEPRPYVFDIPVNGQIGPQVDGFHKGSGELFVNCMIREAKKLGVEILTETAACAAIMKDGKVAGVIAKRGEEELQVLCDKLIIANGSWIKNDEIVDQVMPEFLDAEVLPNAHQNKAYTGDGLKIGAQAGAYIDKESFCLRVMGPILSMGETSPLDALTHAEEQVMVNADGNRFVAEPMVPRIDPFDTGHVLIKQPKSRAYFLYSKKSLQHLIDRSQASVKEGDFDPFGMPPLPDLEVVESWMKEAKEKYPTEIGMAGTWQEAAEQVGIDPKKLCATVEAYNKSCEQKEDWDWFKDPEYLISLDEGPFYILGAKLSTDGAFGGIKVNADMQAFDKTGEAVLDHVYAAGDIASGRHIVLGGIKRQVLNDMSWALSSGFIAGTNAAK